MTTNVLPRTGLWTFQLDLQPASKTLEIVAELETLGFGALWVPEAVGREPFSNVTMMLSATKSLILATGIASIYARDAMTMAAGWKTITEAFPNRFVLGMGVSHKPMVEGVRGHVYDKPVATMKNYLDAMDRAMYFAAPPTTEPVRLLASLQPNMLRLAAEHTSGSHPYFVPVEHTASARETLGPDPILAPEQAVILCTDPTQARKIARTHMATYLGLPNYTNNLRRFGYGDDDLANGGSDRLVDAIVAWGSLDDILNRVKAHHDAGANHVCLQVIPTDGPAGLPMNDWRELAPALASLG